MSAAAIAAAIERGERHSPYIRTLLSRFPDIADELGHGQVRTDWGAIDPDLPVGQALRIAKARLALRLAIGDLAGLLPLEAVTAALSRFADEALDRALVAAVAASVPGAQPSGLAIIALGKHGSGELNYSSDIDPILIYDPARLPRRARDDPADSAVRIARALLALMHERTGDGYVFRVDLRLRPNPEITPIALPVDAAIAYYESSALTWERAAFIRARAAAGDVALGQMFLDALAPFVWRRGLDFGAIAEIKAISRRIRDAYAAGQPFVPGYDLKRGRGGIRECEFFTQIHQMIHGGRDPALRVAPTTSALAALASAGHVDRETATALAEAYRLFRTIEHRLQMVDDRQTHSLPVDAQALTEVAQLHGLDDGAALLALLGPHVARVGHIYDQLDGDAAVAVPQSSAALADYLARLALPDAETVAQRISGWRSGRLRSVRTPAARAAFEAVLPAMMTALAAAPDPLRTINQLDTLLERLPSAINLFRLLEARAPLRRVLMDVLAHAPALASDLSRRADLLDGLIDARAFAPAPAVDTLVSRLTLAGPLEQQLDHVRREVGEMRFALGVQIIAGSSDPIAVSGGYARVAEAALRVVCDAVITDFAQAHGHVPGSELVVLALGRMGGGELTHASDLDLVFLFTGDFRAESDGRRPLGAVHYYNRLAQRVIAGLSVPTAAGPLYDVDTRLRPSGNDGPVAVSLDGFARYQRENAWTWEHMALARARPVYGSLEARAACAAIIADVLQAPRDVTQLCADAVKMRRDMAAAKPPVSELDVKLCAGGLVDLEFAIHVLQLARRCGFDPYLPGAIDVLGLADDVCAANALLTRFLVTMRLVSPSLEVPLPGTQPIVAHAAQARDWDDVLAQLSLARQTIAALWAQVSTGFALTKG